MRPWVKLVRGGCRSLCHVLRNIFTMWRVRAASAYLCNRDLMKLLFNGVLVAVQALRARAHQQSVFSDSSSDPARSSSLWSEKYGAQSDLVFTGPLSFAHLPYARCLEENTSPAFDIALLGMPFDTAVTYRPGARFGPTGIRIGSRRIHNQRGWSLSWGLDPYQQGLDIIDCGDVSHRSSLRFVLPILTIPRSHSALSTMRWHSTRWK
jgi:hypothetical protein